MGIPRAPVSRSTTPLCGHPASSHTLAARTPGKRQIDPICTTERPAGPQPIGVPIGGSRATAAASDHHVARSTFQSASEPSRIFANASAGPRAGSDAQNSQLWSAGGLLLAAGVNARLSEATRSGSSRPRRHRRSCRSAAVPSGSGPHVDLAWRCWQGGRLNVLTW